MTRNDEPVEDEHTPVPDDSPDGPSGASAAGHEAEPADSLLALRDLDSNRPWFVHRLPATIGRGDDCDINLEGNGAKGVYARLIEQQGEVVIEKIRPATWVAVNRDDVERAVLSEQDSVYIDDRVLAVGFQTAYAGARAAPNRLRQSARTRYIALGCVGLAGVIVITAMLVRYFGPEVEPPSEADVPALDAQRTDQLNPLAEALASAAGTTSERGGEVDLSAVTPPTPPTAALGEDEATPGSAESDAAEGSAADDQPRDGPAVASEDRATSARSTPDSAGEADAADSDEASATTGPDVDAIAARTRERAISLYRQAGGKRALELLRSTGERAALAGTAAGERLAATGAHIEQGLALYGSGLDALTAEDLQAAEASLDEMAALERTTVELAKPSRYYERLRAAVVDAMAGRMTAHADNDRDRVAYQWAERLLALGDREAAVALQRRIDRQAADRFDYGYRLETVDLNGAIRVWRDVLRMVPQASPWNRKARDKLAQYNELE